MKLALALLALTASASAHAAGYYCTAIPATQGTRVPPLPGHGTATFLATAKTAAISDCKNRSPFGAGAQCSIANCSAN